MRYFAKITTTFALALVFTAGAALGQTDGRIDQVGTNMDADITQTGDLGNFATIDQGLEKSGKSGFDAFVYQDGKNNDARVEQDGDSDPNANVRQVGDDNIARIDQRFGSGPNAVDVGDIDQDGDENVARVSQTVFATKTGQTVRSYIDQDGNNNIARTKQRYTQSLVRADVVQTGNSNFGKILQKGGGRGVSSFNADITQSGNMNDARITQTP